MLIVDDGRIKENAMLAMMTIVVLRTLFRRSNGVAVVAAAAAVVVVCIDDSDEWKQSLSLQSLTGISSRKYWLLLMDRSIDQ